MENFTPRRQPVIYGAITSTILAFIAMAVALGWFDLDTAQMSAIETFVMAAVGLLALVVVIVGPAWASSRKVTPVSNPHTADGQPAQLVALDPTK